MDKVNLREKLASFDEIYTPKIVGELNGQHVKLAKIKGAFPMHHHADEDELFLTLEGSFVMEYEDRKETIGEGEFVIVPRGVNHRPIAEEECHILLFEPASTVNTGNVRGERTIEDVERI